MRSPRVDGNGYCCGWYMSEPGVVSVCPVSSHVFRPDKIIGHPR
jgi:hypothetical protein